MFYHDIFYVDQLILQCLVEKTNWIFLKCFYKSNHLFSSKWALEISGDNTQILKAVCWSIEAWLRRPETMQNILRCTNVLRRPEPMYWKGLPSRDTDSWIDIMGRRKQFIQLLCLLCLKESDEKRTVTEKSGRHSFGGSTLLWIWILYLDGHSWPSQSSSCSLQVNAFTRDQQDWYETNPLRSWWHYQ